MVYGCGNNTIKIVMVVFNSLLAFSGLALFGLSLWAALNGKQFDDWAEKYNISAKDVELLNNPAQYTSTFWALVVLGGVVFAIGFLGCAGALCESTLMLSIFFVVVLIIFVVQVAAIVLAIVFKGKFKSALKDELYIAQEKSGSEGDFLKPFEKKEKCCGINGTTGQHPCTHLGPSAKQAKGCFDILWDETTKPSVMALIWTGIDLAIELLSMLFACVLIGAFRRQGSYYR